MKRKLCALIAALIATTAMLAACDDDPLGLGGGGGGMPQTITEAQDKISEMPTSTNGSQIEDALDDVFGVELELPGEDVSAGVLSYGDVSIYDITVSDSQMTATEYFNSIREEMEDNGYVATEEDLSYYKIVGNVIYTVSVDSYGGELHIYSGATSMMPEETPGGMIPGGTIPGGTIPGGTIPGGTLPGGQGGGSSLPASGDLTAWPAAKLAEFFSDIAVPIPANTYGTSYRISEENESASYKNIKITCYDVTEDENDLYKEELFDLGWISNYYLSYYGHGNRDYEEVTCAVSYLTSTQSYSYNFTVRFEDAQYELPENVKIVTSILGLEEKTMIKIGNSYYVEEGSAYGGGKSFYTWNNGTWEWYEYDRTNGVWENINGGYRETIVTTEHAVFDFVVDYAKIDFDYAVKDDVQQTIIGRTVDVWRDSSVGMVIYKDAQTGIVLKFEQNLSGFIYNCEVSEYDTTITSFDGYDIPDLT